MCEKIDVSDIVDELDWYLAHVGNQDASLMIIKLDLERCLEEIEAVISIVGDQTTVGQITWNGYHEKKIRK